MTAVTYVHTNGRAVTVDDSTRTARLLAEDDSWTEQKSETKGAGRGTGSSGRRRGSTRKGSDSGGADEG